MSRGTEIKEQIDYLKELTENIKLQLEDISDYYGKNFISEEKTLLLNDTICDFYETGMYAIRKICELHQDKWRKIIEKKRKKNRKSTAV